MRLFLLATLALTASCANVPVLGDVLPLGGAPEPRVRSGAVDQSARNDQAAGWESMRPAEGTPILYGRDGSPVGTTSPGQVVQSPAPLNAGVDDTGGSRVVLLDLYREAKAELDELLLAFDEESAENEAAAATITEQKGRIAELEARVATLTKLNGELENLQFELAGRLAQAQIARLESDRSLLEASLEWRRMNAANAPATTPEEPRR